MPLRSSREFGTAQPGIAGSPVEEPPAKASAPVRRLGVAGGLPAGLRLSMERLSGVPLHDVRVHYNSPHPAKVNAFAYTQGQGIHLARGQEKHLAHEAWHVVQQKQRRVRPTLKIAGRPVNDNADLEHEATAMGARALAGAVPAGSFQEIPHAASPSSATLQRVDSEDETSEAEASDSDSGFSRRRKKSRREAEDDEDFSDPDARKGKTKPPNPGGKVDKNSILTKGSDYEYKTIGGAHYKETTDPTKRVISTHTTGLSYKPDLGRSDTTRPKGQYQTYSHYPLSTGQVTNNQMPQSHWAPSSGGMPSGGVARNGWLASIPHNQTVSKFENPMLQKGSLSKPFEYKTETELRTIEEMAADDDLHTKVASDPRMQGHWSKKARIKDRYKSIAKATPGQKFIKSESRTILPHTAKDVSMPPTEDLMAGLPYRAFNAEGAKTYGEARKKLKLNPSSDEDDSELEEATSKKEQSEYMKGKDKKKKR